jgi:hypothetical protein
MSDWYDRVARRLESDGFDILQPRHRDDDRFDLVARYSRFEITKFGNFEEFFIFRDFRKISIDRMADYSADAFNHAIANKKVGLPCGFFEMVCCYSVAVAEDASNELFRAVRNDEPPKHWSAVEVPVLWLPAEGELAVYERTPMWGAFYWSNIRNQVKNLLGDLRIR